MLQILTGIFIILHGLVHLWYVVLSLNWVEFQPDMGWTGRSWLLSGVLQDPAMRTTSAVLFIASAIAFVISGVGILINVDWLDTVIMISAILSTMVLVVFWDGSLDMIVQKGLIGVLINLTIIAITIF